MGEIFAIIFGAIFVNNFVLSRFLGICPFMGVSKKVETSLGMGMAVTFVMGLASFVTWLLQYYVLVPNQLEYLQTIVFILVIASLVQFVELVIRKASPTLYQSLGIFLPLITTNCAVLGVAILNIKLGYNLFESVVFGVAAAVGFTLALVIMAGIRERLEFVFVPKHFQGVSIAMIIAGILSLAFGGFKGMM
ncbi:MAG: Electron transport complex subunit RsxA [Syntrophomonadaceae bacterium]|nr:Electron transport complex subunit RsxA [Bacillota bacterium]